MIKLGLIFYIYIYIYIEREFQPMAFAPDKTVNLQIDESVNLHICIETRLEWKESKQLQLSLQGK